MTQRRLVSSGSPFEKSIGFSRAVRIGGHISVSGTAPIAAGGGTAAAGDVFGQTKRCLEIIEAAIVEAGGTRDSIIRTRVFLTDISNWPLAAKAHAEVFSDIRPACTFVGISALIDPEWLVEIEADAVVV